MNSILAILMPADAQAVEPKLNESAPLFKAHLHDGSEFDMATRKGSWTVLYFYPKADTPGCTKQACAFRDSIDRIRSQGAEVFGISSDSVAQQAAFHKKYNLNFKLIADPEGKIADLYGAKMPLVKFAKRWTLILDPELKIRAIEKDVDPALDAEKVAARIKALQSQAD